MLRILFWLILGGLVYFALRKKFQSLQAEQREQVEQQRKAETSTEVESMLVCAHCGTYFPASEAVKDAGGQVFCSQEHQRLHGKH